MWVALGYVQGALNITQVLVRNGFFEGYLVLRCYFGQVMDLYGPNLEDLFDVCQRQFTVKTTCMLAKQMVHNGYLVPT